jgi:hypothetical protein
MSSLREHFVFILSDTEIHRLVRIIIKDHGLNLCRSDFNEHILNLFEDIPGLELLSLQSAFDYLNILWSIYHEHQDS